MKGKISITGYKKDSKDKNNDFNIIPGNRITMKNVPHPVFGIDNVGNHIMMYPGGEYTFGGDRVLEIPVAALKKGGDMKTKKIPTNAGFKKLPKEVQDKIIAHLQQGGDVGIPYPAFLKNGGLVPDTYYLPYYYQLGGMSPDTYYLPYYLQQGGAAESTGVFKKQFISPFIKTPEKIGTAMTKKDIEQYDANMRALEKKKQQDLIKKANAQKEYEDWYKDNVGVERMTPKIKKIVGLLDPTSATDSEQIISDAFEGKFDPTNIAGIIAGMIPYGKYPAKLFLHTAGKTGDVANLYEEKQNGGATTNLTPDTYYLPYYLQQGGGIDSTNATKVTTVPTDFSFAGKQDNKTFFKKNVAATKAVVSGAGQADPNKHRQFLIQQLQSGVTPEDLIKAGHATSQGINSLRNYYKPAIVYLENQQPVQNTPVKQPIPLNESDRLDMKQVFPNTGSKYLTFDVPDVNAGYSKATQQYYDPTTYRQIDPLKSFDASGNYTPSYLYDDPTKGVLSEKYRGTKTATRIDPTKIGTTDTLNVNPTREGTIGAGFRFGGSLNKKSMAKFLDGYLKKQFGGTTAPQGDTIDSFTQSQTRDFTNYLKGNVMKHLFMEEMFGKSPMPLTKAQQGLNFTPFIGEDDMTQTVPGYKQVKVPMPDITEPTNQPLSNLKDVYDFNKSIYGWGSQSQQNNQVDWQRASGLADGFKGAMDVFSNVTEANRAKQYQKLLKQQMSAENVFKSYQGSRGDYDINSGRFRPNQMTPPSYKVGGQYNIPMHEVKRLRDMGYEIDIID